MSEVNPGTVGEWRSLSEYAHARGNVARLTIAQALAGANSTVFYATGAIVGNTLAPSHALATLPISIFVVGMAASSLPAGAIAQRWGRRTAFMAGTACGVLAGLLAAWAVMLGSFWIFCVATFFGDALPLWCFLSASQPQIACRWSGAPARCRSSWQAASSPG